MKQEINEEILPMTDVINFFQAMFIFKNSAPSSANKHEIELAVSLKGEAQQLAAVADEEMRNGSAAQNLAAISAADAEKVRIFTEISVWHYNRAAEKYHKSAARFSEAGRVYTKKIRAFNKRAEEMMRRAANAATAVNSLID